MKRVQAPEGWLTKWDAAQLMHCTPRTIENWVKRGLIPSYKLGHRVLFKKEDLLNAPKKADYEQSTIRPAR